MKPEQIMVRRVGQASSRSPDPNPCVMATARTGALARQAGSLSHLAQRRDATRLWVWICVHLRLNPVARIEV